MQQMSVRCVLQRFLHLGENAKLTLPHVWRGASTESYHFNFLQSLLMTKVIDTENFCRILMVIIERPRVCAKGSYDDPRPVVSEDTIIIVSINPPEFTTRSRSCTTKDREWASSESGDTTASSSSSERWTN